MARLDLQCDTCELVLRDIEIPGGVVDGQVKIPCPDCKNKTFSTYWGGGESPGVKTREQTKGEIFDDCKTVGEYWEKTGVDFASDKYSKASKARVEALRQKANKNAKNKGS